MCHVFALIISLILLALSFIILVHLRKNESKKLKGFGYILVILLWISTIFVLVGHFYSMTNNGCQMMKDNEYHHPMMPQK